MFLILRRIPYFVALKRKHRACAALLNPGSAEPLVWPSPLKFISELNPDAKALLEEALVEANQAREKNILKGTTYSLASPVHAEVERIDDCDDDDDDCASEVLFHDLFFICTLFQFLAEPFCCVWLGEIMQNVNIVLTYSYSSIICSKRKV